MEFFDTSAQSTSGENLRCHAWHNRMRCDLRHAHHVHDGDNDLWAPRGYHRFSWIEGNVARKLMLSSDSRHHNILYRYDNRTPRRTMRSHSSDVEPPQLTALPGDPQFHENQLDKNQRLIISCAATLRQSLINAFKATEKLAKNTVVRIGTKKINCCLNALCGHLVLPMLNEPQQREPNNCSVHQTVCENVLVQRELEFPR